MGWNTPAQSVISAGSRPQLKTEIDCIIASSLTITSVLFLKFGSQSRSISQLSWSSNIHNVYSALFSKMLVRFYIDYYSMLSIFLNVTLSAVEHVNKINLRYKCASRQQLDLWTLRPKKFARVCHVNNSWLSCSVSRVNGPLAKWQPIALIGGYEIAL